MTKNDIKIYAETGKQEIFITREFDAPRDLVFKAFTDPDLYKEWIGPRELTTEILVFEPVNGGAGGTSRGMKREMNTHFMGLTMKYCHLNGLSVPSNMKAYLKQAM